MSDEQQIKLVKSDRDKIIDLLAAVIGLGFLAYTTNPDPFDNFIMGVRVRINMALHRWSVWSAIQAIRSLPETDESR